MGLTIRTVMCVSKVPGEHVLSAVELSDGRFAVYLDGALRGGKIWGARELRACINHFLASKAALLHPEQPRVHAMPQEASSR